jgi:cytoskeleton protein RodZ
MLKEEATTAPGNNAGMGLLGDYLKEMRVEKNYSLEKLSQKTKISVNILKSLEANKFDHLPSAAYIKGFVTSYVKVLGLPLNEAINKMEYTYLHVMGKPFPALNHTKKMNTQSASTEADKQSSPHEVIEKSESLINNTKSLIPAAILASVILVFVAGYKIVTSIIDSELNSPKITDHGPKIESSAALTINSQKNVETVKPETSEPAADSATSVALAPAPAAIEIKKEEESKVPNFERNFPPVDFKKVKGKLYNVRTEISESEGALLPDNIRTSNTSGLQNVYITAPAGNTWLSYKIDNNPIESVIISKGKDLFLQGNEIRVFLGNVNVTKIFYNNNLIDTPTKSGVKSLIFPEESNSKFLLPLFPKAKDDILHTSEEYMKRMNLEEEELKKRRQ